jgi:hypothetical protein
MNIYRYRSNIIETLPRAGFVGAVTIRFNFSILIYFSVGQHHRTWNNSKFQGHAPCRLAHPLMFETPLPGIDHCRGGLIAGLDGLVVIF